MKINTIIRIFLFAVIASLVSWLCITNNLGTAKDLGIYLYIASVIIGFLSSFTIMLVFSVRS